MAFVVKDRVKETSSNVGTGTITLLGAVAGYQGFTVIGNGNTTYYTIQTQVPGEWEVGIGTYTASGTTLSRDVVLESSNGGSLVNFSAGVKDVFVTYPAERAVIVDGSTVVVPNSAVVPISAGGTGSNSATFSGANITNLNASSISSGVIGNTYTTANSSNGASTIVLRDASGNFSANIITANGSALTSINASNITLGTLANARTTASDANGASTIVARDASGNFSANVITANGSALTALNASNITSGTLANARTTASSANGASTIVARDASGNFTGYNVSATNFIGTLNGSGANVTSINASNISSGTLDNGRTTGSSANGASTLVLRDASGNFTGYNVSATNFIGTLNGSGANVTSINANNISSGTLGVARGGTGAATLTAEAVIVGNTTGAVKFVSPGTSGNVLTSNGTAWASTAPTPAIGISNDITTATDLYPTFANVTTGTTGTLFTSNNEFLYKPSTGELKVSAPVAANGLVINSTLVSQNYTVAANTNALSVGPITVGSGVNVTVSSGQRWLVL